MMEWIISIKRQQTREKNKYIATSSVLAEKSSESQISEFHGQVRREENIGGFDIWYEETLWNVQSYRKEQYFEL